MNYIKHASILVASGALAFAAASPASAAEVIQVDFTQPNGGQSVGQYSGIITVTVSGTGQSLGSRVNDAFYLVDTQTHDASYYQLTFGLNPLVPLNPSQNAVNYIVGGLPAYSPTNTYTFQLDTGTDTLSTLYFGVGDGIFSDNSGFFTVTIGAVPEPATWAMLILGFLGTGFALRRRNEKVRQTVTYA